MDLTELRAYVTAKDHLENANLPPGTISLTVTHSALKQTWPSFRVELSSSINQVKERIYKHGGPPPDVQRLELVLQPGRGGRRVVLDRGDRPLGFYSALSGMELHVVDLDPHSLAN